MKYKCPLAIIEKAEGIIISSKNYTVMHDGSKGLHTFFGRDGHSSVFSRVYEVYLKQGAKQYARVGDVAGLSGTKMFDWGLFDFDSVLVRILFDYRKGEGEIKIKDKAILRMESVYPSLIKMIKENGEEIEQ